MEINLSERIKIYKIEESQTENGFSIEPVYNDSNIYYKCWSSFKTISGSEFIAAKATNSENIVTFTIRYCNKSKALLSPGATKKFKIKYNECLYDIQFANDYRNLHDWIDIKATILN
ncbi:MAG: phage head closure protein [Cetobacterium sp.]